MGHASNNGHLAHMQAQMGGPGVQGMQAFNGMMMPNMGMGMPMDGMPHMMSNILGNIIPLLSESPICELIRDRTRKNTVAEYEMYGFF
jgi:hypothetical protein